MLQKKLQQNRFHQYIMLKRGKSIIKKNYIKTIFFCVVQLVLSVWDFNIFYRTYIQQGKAENEDKLKQFAYLPAIKNLVLKHDCYAMLCKILTVLKVTVFVYQPIDLIKSFTWNNFMGRVPL